MDTLLRVTKLYTAKSFVPIDFGPWLISIADSVGTITVGDAPDVVETYAISGARVDLTLDGGEAGAEYRIPVTCVSAARAIPRTIIVVLSIPAVAAAPGGTGVGGGSSAVGNLDGGAPDTNYGGTTAIEGGAP